MKVFTFTQCQLANLKCFFLLPYYVIHFYMTYWFTIFSLLIYIKINHSLLNRRITHVFLNIVQYFLGCNYPCLSFNRVTKRLNEFLWLSITVFPLISVPSAYLILKYWSGALYGGRWLKERDAYFKMRTVTYVKFQRTTNYYDLIFSIICSRNTSYFCLIVCILVTHTFQYCYT